MIINANALGIPLADKSVQMIVTSPPYWGLRNYGVSGQLGLERTPKEYIANMITAFRECWRVLRDDGTLWLNVGDSYAGSGGHSPDSPASQPEAVAARGGFGVFDGRLVKGNNYTGNGLKPKDLVGIPWRLAFALQADGWYLRSDIIWNKPNPMPESVTDRPTKSHEYLFLLTKSQRYYYDAEAVREDAIRAGDTQTFGGSKAREGQAAGGDPRNGHRSDENSQWGKEYTTESGRNRRSVWTIPTAPYKGAHFATFPPALVEPCIKAGTSERGCCPKCGKGWRRVVDHKRIRRDEIPVGDPRHRPAQYNGAYENINGKGDAGYAENTTLGWEPSCNCDAGEHEYNEDYICIKCQRVRWAIIAEDLPCRFEPIPCLVFDPFVGSGTTVKVAYDLGRRGVGLDLSLEYLDEQARKRIHNGHTARLF